MNSEQQHSIDPDILRFVSELMQFNQGDSTKGEQSLNEARRQAEVIRARWFRGGPKMSNTRETDVPTKVGNVHVRMHRPLAIKEPQPALVYLHGGGWTMFSLNTHDRIMRELAKRAGVVVIGVDYALSPESKFPFALNQIYGVVRWLESHGAEWGIDANNIAIGGDSAGANLAVSTSLMLRDSGGPNCIRGMLLIYGCYSPEISEFSARKYGAEGNILTSNEMSNYWKNYLESPDDAFNPLASPMLANLEGLPPAFQVLAQYDVLNEQNVEFNLRMRKAGIEAEKCEYPSTTHSFLEAVSIASVAVRALDDCAAYLRKWLNSSLRGSKQLVDQGSLNNSKL